MLDASSSNPTGADLLLALFFLILGLIIAYFFWKKGYFKLPPPLDPPEPKITLVQLLIGFVGYMGIFFILSPLVAAWIKKVRPIGQGELVGYVSWFNFCTQLAIILFLLTLFYKNLPKIFKNSDSKLKSDIWIGIITWALAFPLVVSLSETLNYLVYSIFKVKELPEQLAVQYVKMTLHHPLYFFIAMISIILFAPFLEEFLFRGLLQNYCKRYMKPTWAIFLTAVIFACFHGAPSQGLGNIPIVGALIFLSCFLGFLYERQRSLFASIAMHATFNAISLFNLVFLKENL